MLIMHPKHKNMNLHHVGLYVWHISYLFFYAVVLYIYENIFNILHSLLKINKFITLCIFEANILRHQGKPIV